MRAQNAAAQYGQMYAGLVLVMLPTLILYLRTEETYPGHDARRPEGLSGGHGRTEREKKIRVFSRRKRLLLILGRWGCLVGAGGWWRAAGRAWGGPGVCACWPVWPASWVVVFLYKTHLAGVYALTPTVEEKSNRGENTKRKARDDPNRRGCGARDAGDPGALGRGRHPGL